MAKKIELVIENGIVIGYSGEAKKLVIEDEIKGVADSVFENCEFIEEVYIKSTILKTIGKNAFSGCKKLKKIEIETLKASIGDKAFYGCNKLESFVVPNGAIKIGKNVFSGCKNLIYVVIPETISLIGDNMLDKNSKTVILGEKDSEIEKYAQNNSIVFREDSEKTRKSLLEAQVVVKDTYKDFEIAGEKIRCYKSLLLYQEINEYFDKLEKSFYVAVVENLPKYVVGDATVEQMKLKTNKNMMKFKKVQALSKEKSNEIRTYFEKHSVYIDAKEFDMFSNKKAKTYKDIIVKVAKVYTEILSSTTSNIKELNERVISDAESKITGLGYGVIGDATTVALHAIDEYRVERQQRKEAAAEMRKQFAIGSQRINSKADKVYRDFIEGKALNAIAEAIFEFCDEFKYYLFVELIKKKRMSKAIFDDYNEQNSNKILQKINNGDVDKEYVLALALKEYPLNIDVYKTILKRPEIDVAIFEMIDFLKINKNNDFISVFKDMDISHLFMLENKYCNYICNDLTETIQVEKDIRCKDLISQLNDFTIEIEKIDDDIWDYLIKNYTIIKYENTSYFGLTDQELKLAENSKILLKEKLEIAREKKSVKDEDDLIKREQSEIRSIPQQISNLEISKVRTTRYKIGLILAIISCVFGVIVFGEGGILIILGIILVVSSILTIAGLASNINEAKAINKKLQEEIDVKRTLLAELQKKYPNFK